MMELLSRMPVCGVVLVADGDVGFYRGLGFERYAGVMARFSRGACAMAKTRKTGRPRFSRAVSAAVDGTSIMGVRAEVAIRPSLHWRLAGRRCRPCICAIVDP